MTTVAAPTDVAPERLNRYLARRAAVSRRGADELIAQGRVRCNGRAARLGELIQPGDVVAVDGVVVGAPAAARTVMLNKPVGVVSTRRDPQGRPTVVELVPDALAMVPVGRLDTDSRGLLLLSSDGELAHRMTHPRFGVRKRYRVTVHMPASGPALGRLRQGIELDDGFARPVSVRPSGRDAAVLDIEMGEGRRREVRRMCAAVGLEVVDLVRLQFGPLHLGALAEGAWRDLAPGELAALRSAGGLAQAGRVP